MTSGPAFRGWRWGSVWRSIVSGLVLVFSPLEPALAQPKDPASANRMPDSLLTKAPLLIGLQFVSGGVWQQAAFDRCTAGSACGTYEASWRRQSGFDAFFQTPLDFHPNLWFSASFGFSRNALALEAPGEATFEGRLGDGTPVWIRKKTRFDSDVSAFRLGVGLLYEPFRVLRLSVAPWAQYNVTGAQKVEQVILEPEGAVFAGTGGPTAPLENATAVDLRALVPGVDVRIGARLPMGRRLWLHPEARGSFGIGSLASNVAWNEIGVAAALGLSYDIAKSPPPAAAPPLRRFVLRATIDARGVDEQGKEYQNPVIEIEEAPWSEWVPVVPQIFFDSASAVIPGRYGQLSAERTDDFHLDSLTAITPLDIHWQMLNIVGERMREDDSKRLVIVGAVSSDEAGNEPEKLGMRRAEAVAEYLVQRWGIRRSRITLQYDPRPLAASSENTAEGRAENRRVELRFADENLAHPIHIRRLATIASPPAVRFYQSIVADTTIVSWYVAVEQGGKELLRFVGSGAQGSFMQQKEWSLGDMRVNRDLTPIKYRAVFRDALGQETSAEGAFRIVERTKRRTSAAASDLSEFHIVGFDYNSAELLPEHLAQLEDVARALSADADVSITGYTDRLGAPESNRQLSLDRAKAVLAALRTIRERTGEPMPRKLSVLGLGAEREIFNNDLPEGRLLSRMVRITVSRPLK